MAQNELSDSFWLDQALVLARRGKGQCAPNPAVGAVVVRDGKVIGTGYHRGPGLPHAEVIALEQLTDTKSATLYVTLEPCSHFGRTPPCTDLILAKQISRVVFAYRDPNPLVQGRGADILRAAGVECIELPIPKISDFYRSYLHSTQTKRPWVTVKLAMTLDGKIALAGDPAKRLIISGDLANHFTHVERRAADAILTTCKTVIADDPQLDARLPGETVAKHVYILDRHLQTPRTAKIFETASAVTLIASRSAATPERLADLASEKIRVETLEAPESDFLWDDIFTLIGRDGVHDLWVEAGGTTFRSLTAAHAVQRSILIVAPHWIGSGGIPAIEGALPFGFSDSAKQLQWIPQGRDVVCEILW